MKIRPASDWHVEFLEMYGYYPRDWNTEQFLPVMDGEKEQVLFLAGDIMNIANISRFWPLYRDLSERFLKVYAVAGNHEFYKGCFQTGYREYDTFLKDFPNIQLLQNNATWEGDNFIFGATLWTDFNNGDEASMSYAKQCMNDYRLVKRSEETDFITLTPNDTVNEHVLTCHKMKGIFKDHEAGDHKRIVITHHLPAPECGDKRFEGSALNPAFSSDLKPLMEELEIDLWFFGHTHSSVDIDIGKTRLVCNPRGYRNGQENPNYDPFKVIEI